MLGRVQQYIRELLFPCFCVSCDREGSWWCASCREKYDNTFVSTCLVCNVAKTNGEPCAGCARNSSLDKISACFHYREYDAVGKLIKAFKYRYSTDIQNVWREVVVSPTFENTDATIIPVPLHGRRERERGFNQAQQIAQVVAQRYNLPLNTNDLHRVRHTAQQAKLGRTGRIANMKGAFEWQGIHVPKNIILVDDVYTTGATMQECARVLKLAGAQKVEGFVIARG